MAEWNLALQIIACSCGETQSCMSLLSQTQKEKSLGPGLVSVSDSDSKFRDAQESDSVSDSSLRFVQY